MVENVRFMFQYFKNFLAQALAQAASNCEFTILDFKNFLFQVSRNGSFAIQDLKIFSLQSASVVENVRFIFQKFSVSSAGSSSKNCEFTILDFKNFLAQVS